MCKLSPRIAALRKLLRGMPLHDVKGYEPGLGCTIVALAAVTGRHVREIDALLREAGRERGYEIESFRRDHSPRDWRRAIALAGGEIVKERDYRADFQEAPFVGCLSIGEWMDNGAKPLSLIQCERRGPQGVEGHLFAAEGQQRIDANAGGRAVAFGPLEEELEGFYVVRVLELAFPVSG